MNPTVIGFRPQRFPQKWLGRQVQAEVTLKEMDREAAIEAIRQALGSTTVKLPE